MECLKDIIGVTPTDCGCIVDNLDVDTKAKLKKSVSGVYLDDLPGGLELRALKTVDSCKTMADLALGAIENASKILHDDLVVALGNKYAKGLKTYMGYLAQLSYSGTLPSSKRYQGIMLRANSNADAIVIINKIMVIVNGSENLTLKIVKAIRGAAVGTEVKSIDFASVANSYTTIALTEPITLPLTERGQALDYYFIYDTQVGAGVAPKDCKIDCNCGSASIINSVAGYLKPMGVQIDDLNNLTEGLSDKYTRGVLLDVELRCNTEQLVCGNYDSQQAVAVTLARSVWYKAGELLIESVMKSNNLNIYTMQNKEYLWGKRNHFRSEYETRVIYLSEAIDISASNCFICRNDNTMTISQPIITDGGLSNINEAIAAMNESTGFKSGSVIDGVINLDN